MTPTPSLDDDEETTRPAVAVAVASDSPLARIRAQRERNLDQVAGIHVPVPRTSDPKIYVVYSPVAPAVIEKAVERRQKQAKATKDPDFDWVVMANADVLVKHCQGVYWLDDDDKEHALAEAGEEWPKYDHRLAEALGVQTESAVATCRALFTTGADVVMHALELAEVSGLDRSQLEERFKGE